jgi:Kef-type K+ transport system membrane component KefB
LATKGMGSTIILNVLLWLSLVISIPLAGSHPVYVSVAIVGAVALALVAALAFGLTRGAGRVTRIVHASAAGSRAPTATSLSACSCGPGHRSGIWPGTARCSERLCCGRR